MILDFISGILFGEVKSVQSEIAEQKKNELYGYFVDTKRVNREEFSTNDVHALSLIHI